MNKLMMSGLLAIALASTTAFADTTIVDGWGVGGSHATFYMGTGNDTYVKFGDWFTMDTTVQNSETTTQYTYNFDYSYSTTDGTIFGYNWGDNSNSTVIADETVDGHMTISSLGNSGNLTLNLFSIGDSHLSVSNFTLTTAPVPEPETYALMCVGLLGLIAANRKRKHKEHIEKNMLSIA